MSDADPTASPPTLDVLAQQLDMANRQLARFAEDLRRMVLEERARSADLAAAHARLAVLDRLKSEFLCFISHELRTPLTGLSAMSLLELDQDLESQRDLVIIARSGYGRLERFIQQGIEYFDWLGRDPCTPPQRADLVAVVRAAAASVPASLTLPGASLVHGDPQDLERVVRILLDNAAKFAPGRLPALRVLPGPDETAVVVSDTGRGFPPELAAELFRPFTVPIQVHHSQGSGLNLALARAILDVHGGRIEAASEGLDRGARFTVVLRTATA